MKPEDYVSYEVARMLEEKGYKCEDRYISREITIGVFERNDSLAEAKKSYKAPPLHEVARWLREEHNIAVCPVPYKFMWDYTIFDLTKLKENDFAHKILGSCVAWSSYEVALNEGIKNAINFL